MSISLKELSNFRKVDPRVDSLVRRLAVNSYDDFIIALHNDIYLCISDIEVNAKFYNSDKVGEDRISSTIRTMLNERFYTAEAKFVRGGNTDLTVVSFDKKYRWIGEAKLVNGTANKHIWGGFLQLVTRYTSGVEPIGGILIYIFASDAKDIMEKYKNFVIKQTNYSFTIEDCNDRGLSEFCTIHRHCASGKNFRTKYFPVVMYSKPAK